MITHGLGTYGNGTGTVTPLDHKMANLAKWVKTAANTIRPGLLWDGNATVITGKANMSYDVRAFTAVLSRGATAGAVELSNDAVYNVVTTAAPGSNSRYDVIYLWQREFSIDGTDSNPVIGVVQGTAAATPTVPSLAAYPGAIELGRALVGAGITATTSATISQTAPFTATAGGVVPFRNTTERDAGSYVEGQPGWLIDSDTNIVYNGTAWSVVTAGLVPIVPTIANITGSASVGVRGAITLTGVSVIDIEYASTLFDNYLWEFDFSASSAPNNLQWQARSAGATISTGYFSTAVQWISGSATVTTSSTVVSVCRSNGTGGGGGKLEITGPMLAEYTKLNGQSSDGSSMQVIGGTLNATTQCSGAHLTLSTGTVTGTIRIYGYNN